MREVQLPVNDELRTLVDEYRGRCLWFLRQEYYPETVGQALRVLDNIQSYGDVRAFKRAGELKQWVLAHSSDKSVASWPTTAGGAARVTWPAASR